MIAGFAVGAASMLSPLYISEVSPAKHRGRMVSLNQLAVFTGQASAFISNNFLMSFDGVNNWRWMIGVMVLPSVVFLLFMFFVPESPRWLVTNGETEKARNAIARLSGIDCGGRGTSCPDQLAKALTQLKNSR